MSELNALDYAETGCCPRFDFEPWQEKEIVFKDKLFVKVSTRSFLHIPLNMGKVMGRTMKAITNEHAEVKGLDFERLTGTYLTKVYEGSFSDIPKWIKDMERFVKSKSKSMKQVYSFYTTCPKCAKVYGKNYVVLFAEIEI